MQTLVRCGVSYKVNSAFANGVHVPRLLQACQKTVIQSVISAQSQPKTQFSKPSCTIVSMGGGPVPHRAPLTSAGWCGTDARETVATPASSYCYKYEKSGV